MRRHTVEVTVRLDVAALSPYHARDLAHQALAWYGLEIVKTDVVREEKGAGKDQLPLPLHKESDREEAT